METYQQGDVNIWTTRIPPKAQAKNGALIREGEVTGHAHRLTGSEYELLQMGARVFARILSGDCAVVHEEHKTIALPPGEYEFGPTYEYDHFAEEAQEVLD